MIYQVETGFYADRMERQRLTAKWIRQKDILPAETVRRKKGPDAGRKVLCGWKKVWQRLKRRFAPI